MWPVLTFWLLLGLPGLALLQRFDRASLDRGPLSVAGRAYLASFGLLTPVSVIGYLTHAPLAVLSAAIVLSVLGGGVALARDRRWLALFERPSLSAVACGAWLVFDLWLGARVGSHTWGDAGFHIARVRLIGELGFNSWDPLLSGQHFAPIYHTNLYHALIAASAQLGRVDAGVAYIWVWPFLKLLAAAGVYELALAVFGARFCGYLAAITAGACFATTSTLPFPNSFAPFAVLPFAIACVVDAVADPPRLRHAAWLAVVSLVLAQTHSLYALFFGLAVAPMIALRFAYLVARRRAGRLQLAAALAALGLSLPWFWAPAESQISALWAAHRLEWISTASAQATPAPAPPVVKHANDRAIERFIRTESGSYRLDPMPFTSPNNPDAHGIAALVLLAAFARRRHALAALAVLASVSLFLFVPALCTLLTEVLAHWIVLRLTQVYFAVCLAVVPGVLFYLLARGVAVLWPAAAEGGRRALLVQAAIELAGVTAGLAYARAYGVYTEPWTIDATWQAAREFKARDNAERIARRARFFAANIEPGSTVMAPLLRDYDIPMHCACHAVAFRRGRGERGQTDLAARRAAVEQFYARDTSAETRLELLRRYDVRYVFTSPRRAAALQHNLRPAVRKIVHEGDDAIVILAR